MAGLAGHWSGLLALAMMEPSTLVVLSGNSVKFQRPCSERRISSAICSAVHVLFLHLMQPAMMAMLSWHPCLCLRSLRHWFVTGSGIRPRLVMHWWPKDLLLVEDKSSVDETLSTRSLICCCTFLRCLVFGSVSCAMRPL